MSGAMKKSGPSYSIFSGMYRTKSDPPLEVCATLDYAILRSKKFAKEDMNTFLIARDGVDFAHVAYDGDVRYLPRPKEGRP